MSWAVPARFARRELRGGLSGFRIFLACLALGVAAIAGVGSVRSAIEQGLEEQGAILLGGDAQVEFTYRFASEEERAWMESAATAVSEVTDFRSMATVLRDGTSDRGLTQVKSVDAAYPLLGDMVLDPAMPLSEALSNQGGVMAPVLADRLGLAPGDTFRLGTQEFTLRATIVTEPDDAGDGFGLGPRTIVLTQDLQGSGLLAPGSLYETEYRLLLPEGADLDATKQAALDQFEANGLSWRDARNGAPGIARFVERLGSFLVLVGLSGLAVGGVGVSAAVRAYLAKKTSVIATLRTLGATRAVIFRTYFLQIGALSLLGIAIGLVLGAAIPIAFGGIINDALPVPAVFTLHIGPLSEAALYGLLTALVFTLWPLARAEDVRAATLFRDALGSAKLLPAPRYLIATAGLLIALVGSAALLSGSARLTLWTAGGIFGALLVLVLTAFLIRWLARLATGLARGRPVLRWALGAIGGPGESAGAVVLSLGLGLSVLAAVGQIDGNLRAAIQRDLPDIAPSYFFVDIQKDQMPGYLDRLENDPAVSRIDSAPMLRGVVTRINGQPAQEVVGPHWVVRGDRGVTYAAQPDARTTVTEGEWWPEDYSGPPQISFAAEEAEEMGLQLGDTVTINVLGRDITGTITSFRDVDFSTAGIGFVLTMNPAALQGAPHTFISTVYAEPEAEAAILRDLANTYPNITAIRVRDAIDRVSELLEGIGAAIRWGAAATLLTGFLVLIGAAAAGEGARTYEAAILKTLGASRARILSSFALRSALLGAGAGAVAIGAGIAGGWAVATFVMETDFSVIWGSALGIVAGGIIATLLAGLAFAWRPLAARPAGILRARE
ncbi:ABC transporter permease [Tropicibacter naphthalenivorans]|uniref:Lipoprotein releasing system, transmembrane protein, LolC/E family n=1 Tax=Tropicibacter naphthalenivorans TaxID=441103 RepID=A0A0P1GUP4_9RHOB|nr:FtsX-like permease family protein [Tropicibacter naphthalenivorans]CUH79140.1 lipoprotein releasing system, transmembrane protein, LolC/E family [Tropicibacter naphthalenivorans]SMD03309.1 putative ABC transport system permease protein [Tropicibacter naphthalenivorans]